VTVVDEPTMRVVRRALAAIADDLRVRGSRRGSPPRPLDLAVLAVKVSQALELVAAEQVERAREIDGATWEAVGEAFGTSMQSAHARFRRRS
jgi:hypothetical protein